MVLEEIQNPTVDLAAPPKAESLPSRLLYASGARLGGTGLDTTSLHGALASHRAGFLGRAIAYGNGQSEIPSSQVQSLAWHPVRLLSFLESQEYYGAKRRWADLIASRVLRDGDYDGFHGWSGDCMRTLVTARQKRIPSVLDIPTWHRNKGKMKPFETKTERETRALSGLAGARKRLAISRQRVLMEYDLADVILVASECAAQTFLDVGIPPEKLCYVARGVDPTAYTPAPPPDLFRLVFVGALIKRKGVHHLLDAWKRLNLKNAELVLIGSVHDEIKPYLKDAADFSVKLPGFVSNVGEELSNASAFVFPSECEGSAKVNYEAAACGLAQITTREAGDVVVDGENGLIIPPNNPDALTEAIRYFYDNPEKLSLMGAAGRKRIEEQFTWDHYRIRVLHAYAQAKCLCHDR